MGLGRDGPCLGINRGDQRGFALALRFTDRLGASAHLGGQLEAATALGRIDEDVEWHRDAPFGSRLVLAWEIPASLQVSATNG